MHESLSPLGVSPLKTKLEKLAQSACAVCSVDFWGLEFRSAGKQAHLRIFIDHADGIGIQSCEEVSRQLSDILDIEDIIDVAYTLEVSSPGVNRRLFTAEQYQQYVGCHIQIRLKEKLNDRGQYKGKLLEASKKQFTMLTDEQTLVVSYDTISQARLEESIEINGNKKGKS